MRKFIELLESQLGYSEKSGGYTKFGDWYGKNVEFDADYTSAPWCDMYLSWAAEKLGYQEWIGQFAYTVHHAQWFRQQDAWGTVPKPGAIVFFDWRGSDKISHIDHVGIVTRVEGNRIHTIEGNIDGGVAKRKERDTGKVVGYGYPEKIKARLDREATEKQTILTPATAGDNAVVIGPGPNLIAMAPAPVPTPETSASTGPGRNSEGVTSKPAPGHTAATAKGKAAPGDDAHAVSGGNPAANTQRSDRTTTKAPGETRAPATGRTSPGKHAKASTADTSALAVTPTATARDLATPVPGFDSPAVLAPVLLAAAAILAHGKARQSRVRLLASASGRAAVAPASSPRRAPGRRRMPRNVSARDLSYAPTPAGTPEDTLASRDLSYLPTPAGTPEHTPVDPGLGNAPISPSTPENTLASRDLRYAPIPADASEHTPVAPDLWDAFLPSRGATSPRESVPESTFAPTATTGFPSVTTSVAHVEEPSGRPAALSPVPRPRDDRPRAPYRGRRRLQEQAVAESSTWVQDSPPRGRRHRRADPVVTTVPVTPTRPARPVRPIAPTRSTTSARPVPGPRTAVPVSTVRTGRGEPAVPAGSATLLAEPGDILVHSGYRGRRRARTPV
ncbi:CHAP domain-containing protein [Streptosporangium sp. NPDC000509]|uniref:CHAP domain-containing protein n=1 Tax=Streptosporangium sp. NPDC000509 TaxID=3366186 RepID=UPI0036ACBDFE